MAESNRVVEALRKLKELRTAYNTATIERNDAAQRASSALTGLENVLRQVEWGVGANKPTRAIRVDGLVWVITWRKDDTVTVEPLEVEAE